MNIILGKLILQRTGYLLIWKRILLLKIKQRQSSSNNILKLVLGERYYKNESFSQRSLLSVVGLSLRQKIFEANFTKNL